MYTFSKHIFRTYGVYLYRDTSKENSILTRKRVFEQNNLFSSRKQVFEHIINV